MWYAGRGSSAGVIDTLRQIDERMRMRHGRSEPPDPPQTIGPQNEQHDEGVLVSGVPPDDTGTRRASAVRGETERRHFRSDLRENVGKAQPCDARSVDSRRDRRGHDRERGARRKRAREVRGNRRGFDERLRESLGGGCALRSGLGAAEDLALPQEDLD